MKNHFHCTAIITLFAACSASAPTGFAQAEQIALAGPDWEARVLSRMVNQPIRANTPTGFPSVPGVGQQLRGTVNSVEQALQNVASIPRGNVQVVPENRIVLRGTVDNEQQKAEAHRAAIQAAPGVRVDNEITVRSRWQ